MKVNEITKMDESALAKRLSDLKSELFNLRFQHAINQLDNPTRIHVVKKDIARVMTVMRQHELSK